MAVIGNLLRDRARLSPDMEAIVSGNRRIRYREYNHMVNQLAHYLLESRIEKGDRIAILCKNQYPMPLIYLAAAKIGAITVPLNWRMKTDELRWILEDCRPRILFYDDDFKQILPLLNELDFLEQQIRVGDGETIHPFFEDLYSARPGGEPKVEVHEEDPALIIYTSGTTGRPKGVVNNHANIYAAGVANTNTLDLRYKDRFLFVTPLFHISGMMFMLAPIMRGFTLVLETQFHPLKIWELLQAEQITGMMSVPVILNYMMEGLKVQEVDVPSLRTILCGGSLVPAPLIRVMFELGYHVVQVYGATETSGAITYWMPDMGIETCNSVGPAIFHAEIKIIDPSTGEALPHGEIGEIICRSPVLFAGYWNRPQETEKVLKNGWYHTGDLGWMEENGFLHIVDRLKDVVITGGEKVFPAQVESVLQQLEGVAETAVVGVRHEVWGELARAYVVLKEEAVLSEEDLLAHARKHLADHNLHDVVFVKELPKNSMGKVLKFVLREHANQENHPAQI